MSPTFEVRAGFAREFARLSREQDRAFRDAVQKLVDALVVGREPPRSHVEWLRVGGHEILSRPE
jgi:mRNA-degrading endonuclease RelE of RelBE toxin-antitoxin system